MKLNYIICLLFILKVLSKSNKKLIYILIWTTPDVFPFPSTELEQFYFKNKNCKYQNCYVTQNKTYFNDTTKFDVILFNVINIESHDLKRDNIKRSEHQKYVFFSRESPEYYNISEKYNNFFNLTWTFKLDSDIVFKYFVVRNRKGTIVGPRKDMNWMDEKDMKPTPKYVKNKLRQKKIAVAWIVSHCDTTSHREIYYENLKRELSKYNHRIDVYGECGERFIYPTPYNLKCDRLKMDECYALLESDYYFYLSFENSICVDYVTEKILIAVQHFTVPVVYGGANYNRFLPGGSYLNARNLGPADLASIMNETISNKEKYYEFFKWHRYYSFHGSNENADSDPICAFCAFLNDERQMSRTNVYVNIENFWHRDNVTFM